MTKEVVVVYRNQYGVQVTKTYVVNEKTGEVMVSMVYGPAENYGVNGKEGV